MNMQSEFYVDEANNSDEDDYEEVLLDSIDRKSQTLTFIPSIEKSFEILQQTNNKKIINKNG